MNPCWSLNERTSLFLRGRVFWFVDCVQFFDVLILTAQERCKDRTCNSLKVKTWKVHAVQIFILNTFFFKNGFEIYVIFLQIFIIKMSISLSTTLNSNTLIIQKICYDVDRSRSLLKGCAKLTYIFHSKIFLW